MTQQDAIQDCLDRFNFEKVHAYMVLTGWTYAGIGTPTLEDVKDQARAVLSQACRSSIQRYPGHSRVSTGGFEARVDSWENSQPRLTLMFSIESKESGYIHDLAHPTLAAVCR
jgi:hypothetical protein